MGMEKVLQSIKKAEQAAEQTLSDAQTESSRILSDARRDAADLGGQDGAEILGNALQGICSD